MTEIKHFDGYVAKTKIDGRPCVALGEETLVFYAEFIPSKKLSRYKVGDLRYPPLRHSSWITGTPEDLRGRKGTIIRKELEAEFKSDAKLVLDRAIEILQDDPEFFTIGEWQVTSQEKGRKSQADKMVGYALESKVELFHDQRKVPYIRIYEYGHFVNYRLRTKYVRAWLAGKLWKTEGKAPGSEALQSALNVLEAIANEGETVHLWNRVASDGDGGIWIDMADEGWRAIHVTDKGWEIVPNPPPLFRRYSHQKPLVEPNRNGSIIPLLDFAHLKHLGDQLLYLTASLSYLVPTIPHPILLVYGPQGGGKTWLVRATRTIIDPSVLDVLSLPKREAELVQNLDHHYFAPYDNTGKITERTSNVLCRAVTGTGVSKRQLYTDDDDVIYNYHRCCALTDINIAAERGDLFERSVLLGLKEIDKRKRKTEKELRALMVKQAPVILGGMLNLLVKAIQIYPTLNLKSLNRMADFTLWGFAFTKAMGVDPRRFLEAYQENMSSQHLEVLRASPVADVLIRYMELMTEGVWDGTPSQLHSTLTDFAKELKINTRQRDWPKKPHALTRKLNELAPSFPAVGIQINQKRTGKSRMISITAVGSVTSVTRTDDWGKGPDLRAYISDASVAINDTRVNHARHVSKEHDAVDSNFGDFSKSPQSEVCHSCGMRTAYKDGLCIDCYPIATTNALIEVIRHEKQVGELWPQLWLVDKGLSKEDANNVINGLLATGKLIQSQSGSWEVPK